MFTATIWVLKSPWPCVSARFWKWTWPPRAQAASGAAGPGPAGPGAGGAAVRRPRGGRAAAGAGAGGWCAGVGGDLEFWRWSWCIQLHLRSPNIILLGRGFPLLCELDTERLSSFELPFFFGGGRREIHNLQPPAQTPNRRPGAGGRAARGTAAAPGAAGGGWRGRGP